jgi:hypothetical protein
VGFAGTDWPGAVPGGLGRACGGAGGVGSPTTWASSALAKCAMIAPRVPRSKAGSAAQRTARASSTPARRLASGKPNEPAVPCTRWSSRRTASSTSALSGEMVSCAARYLNPATTFATDAR